MKDKNLGIKLDKLYSLFAERIETAPDKFIPHIRRFIRFISLPYCFIFIINWKECPVSKIKVLSDMIYIFYSLKTYPFHYSLCRLWESDRETWKYYYGSIYEPYQRARLSKEVQPKKYSIVFDDKEVCYQICKGMDIPLPDQVEILDPNDDYQSKLNRILHQSPKEVFIIKPVLGAGGKDIFLAYIEDNIACVKNKDKIYSLSELNLTSRSVVQKYLAQHPDLVPFSKCFSTIRIATLLAKNGDVIILGALIRFGLGNSYVDNTSSGGIAVGIDIINGTLNKFAYNNKGMRYAYHPDSNMLFDGFAIPCWERTLSLAKNVQKSFPYYKMLGLDIGITMSGPLLIEINPAHDNIGIEQKCGPILLDQRIRDEFRKYDLLVVDKFL